ncbi:hypothetical protein B0O99DRAFT_648094 [Bisporella sp. PMI_857]|nr:hypothetical protein B0O99DRAFT_648094 [Bisporella sp. PMI_857]
MSTAGPVVPPGQYPPFAVVTDTDHSAWIIIATALGLSLILLFSVIKIFIRWSISSRVEFDEAFLATSTIFAVIQSSIILGAVSAGLGKSIELVLNEDRDRIQRMYYTSTLFFILSLGLSKASVAFLLLRLTPQKHHRQAFYTIVALIAVWTVASTFALALQCDLARPWILIQQKCPGMFLRWKVISAFDIGFELGLVALTVYLVYGLQASLETKLTVVFAFAMRLPMIVAIVYRLKTFNADGLTSNPTLLQDRFIVWTQAELCYSIMAAITPSLRPFIKSLATNYGTKSASGYGTAYGSSYGNITDDSMQPGSYQLTSFRPKGKGDEYKYRVWSKSAKEPGTEQGGSSTRADNASVGSSESQRMIIKKDLTWEVSAVNS